MLPVFGLLSNWKMIVAGVGIFVVLSLGAAVWFMSGKIDDLKADKVRLELSLKASERTNEIIRAQVNELNLLLEKNKQDMAKPKVVTRTIIERVNNAPEIENGPVGTIVGGVLGELCRNDPRCGSPAKD